MHKNIYGSENNNELRTMNLKFVDDYIQKKLSENENYIRYTFYELRVKNNLSEDEVDKFLELNKNYLEKKGYKVFFTGAKFTYENANRTVQPNELMIAIKEKNER